MTSCHWHQEAVRGTAASCLNEERSERWLAFALASSRTIFWLPTLYLRKTLVFFGCQGSQWPSLYSGDFTGRGVHFHGVWEKQSTDSVSVGYQLSLRTCKLVAKRLAHLVLGRHYGTNTIWDQKLPYGDLSVCKSNFPVSNTQNLCRPDDGDSFPVPLCVILFRL
jgi:hypothetical protein